MRIFFILVTYLLKLYSNAQSDTTFFRSFNLHAREISINHVVESSSYFYVFFKAKYYPGGSTGPQPQIGIYDKEGFLLDYYDLFPFSVIWSSIYPQYIYSDRYILVLDFSDYSNPNNVSNGLMLLDMKTRSIVWRNGFKGWLLSTNDTIASALENMYNYDEILKLGFVNINNGTIVKYFSIDSIIDSFGLEASHFRYAQHYSFGDTLILKLNSKNILSKKLLISFVGMNFYSFQEITDSAISRFYSADKNFEVSIMMDIIDSIHFMAGYYNYCRNFTLWINDKINHTLREFKLDEKLQQKCFTINNLIFNSDSTFTILYTYSNRSDYSPTNYCLANINMNGDVEWCMDYGLPFGRNYISNLRKSKDGGYFFIHSLGQLQALCKTDKRGKIYDSDFGVTYTFSNCENVKVLEKPDIQSNIFVFPNPSNSKVTILSKNKLMLKVFSVEGKYLGTYNLTEFESQIDLSYLKSGMYFFVFFDELNE
ncbi:T9SS type A sorting domain-containing protein, partial [Thermaurantimonas aggregans]